MLTKLTLGAVVIAAAALMTPASAAPLSPAGVNTAAEAAEAGVVQQVHWRYRHHRRWWRYDDDDGWWYRRHRHHRWWRHYRYHRYW